MYLRNVAISITLWVMGVEKENFATHSSALGSVGAELGVRQELSVADSWMFLPS